MCHKASIARQTAPAPVDRAHRLDAGRDHPPMWVECLSEMYIYQFIAAVC
jgi:hypothetical protein